MPATACSALFLARTNESSAITAPFPGKTRYASILYNTIAVLQIAIFARTQSYLDGARLEHRAACRRMLVSSQLRYALEYLQTCLLPTLRRPILTSRLRTSACITPLNVVSG